MPSNGKVAIEIVSIKHFHENMRIAMEIECRIECSMRQNMKEENIKSMLKLMSHYKISYNKVNQIN